jgi:hypothetical protein
VFSANASVTIERSIDQVFAYLVDFEENLPRWAGGIVVAQRTTTGPTGVSSQFRVVAGGKGPRIVSRYVVTAFEPPTLFGAALENPIFDFTERCVLEPFGAMTALRQQTQVQPQCLFRLVDPLMASGIRRLPASDLARLKSLLEAAR